MIVACAGHTEEEFIKKAWQIKIDEILQKPVNIYILQEILKEIIKQDWLSIYYKYLKRYIIILLFLYFLN